MLRGKHNLSDNNILLICNFIFPKVTGFDWSNLHSDLQYFFQGFGKVKHYICWWKINVFFVCHWSLSFSQIKKKEISQKWYNLHFSESLNYIYISVFSILLSVGLYLWFYFFKFDFQSFFLCNNKVYLLQFGSFYSVIACSLVLIFFFFFFRNLEIMHVFNMHFIRSLLPLSLYYNLNIVTLERRHLST